MKKLQFLFLVVVPTMFLCSRAVFADTVYVYTGAKYTTILGSPGETTSESILGNFRFSSPLPSNLPLTNEASNPSLLSWSFSDGPNTYSSANFSPGLTSLGVGTDQNGNINAWDLSVRNAANTASFQSISFLSSAFDEAFGCSGQVCTEEATVNSPGAWATVSPVGAVTYTYVGNNYTSIFGSPGETTSERISGSITFSSLQVNLTGTNVLSNPSLVSWSFSDGPDTYSNTNYDPSFSFLDLSTDGAGAITGWALNPVNAADTASFVSPDPFLVDEADGCLRMSGGLECGTEAVASPLGEWGMTFQPLTTTPEPSTLFLVASGLAGLIAARRRRWLG